MKIIGFNEKANVLEFKNTKKRPKNYSSRNTHSLTNSASAISLEEGRKFQKVKKLEKSFKNYFKNLSVSQLQVEASEVIGIITAPKTNVESETALLRAVCLLEELATRIETTNHSNAINEYAKKLKERSHSQFS